MNHMNHTDLTGTTVLVNPLLEHDPTNNQGMVGRIEHSFIDADEMYVDFDNREGRGFSLYSMDALLVLKPFQELEKTLFSGRFDKKDDPLFTDVASKVENIIRHGGHSRDVLEMAKTHPTVLAQATFSIKDSLELSMENEYSKSKDIVMNAQRGTLVLIGGNSSAEGNVGLLGQPYPHFNQYSVQFNGMEHAAISTKDLLVMKPHSELFRDILTIGKELSKEDFKLALQANVIQENGGPAMQKVALELLQGNPAAIEFATLSLHEKIELEVGREQDQKYSGGYGR